MTLIAVDQLAETVRESLSPGDGERVKIELLGDSGFKAVVDGEYCLSNVHVWPVGTGLSEYLYAESGTGESRSTEFATLQAAIAWVQSEIQAALVRATDRGVGENAT